MDFAAEIRRIPPVTRTFVFSLIGLTSSLIIQVTSGYQFFYDYRLVFYRWQIHRLLTSFFVGSTNINLIFEILMLYNYTNDLESRPYSGKSGDLAWQAFWAGASIILLSVPIGTAIFLRPFIHCLAYLSSSLAPVGAQTSIFGIVTLPITYLPYVLLLFELLSGGPPALMAALPGTISGHLWWWSVWGTEPGSTGGALARRARAPGRVARFLGDRQGPGGEGASVGGRGGGGVYVTAPRRFAAPGESRPSGGSSEGGYQWGSGRRLGNN